MQLVEDTQVRAVGRSPLNPIALVLASGLFGLFGLPAVFGALPAREPGLLWLALAIADCVCLLPAIRPILSGLAAQLNRLPGMRGGHATWSGRTSLEVARLLAVAGYLVLLQAILRHPLVAVFGASVDPFLVEASFTIVALLAVLALLVWVYAAGRPLLEGIAWAALDSVLATSGTAQAPESAQTVAAPTVAAPRRAENATVVSPQSAASHADIPTEVSPPSDASEAEIATVIAAPPAASEAEPTVVLQPPGRSEADIPTVVSPHSTSSEAATEVVGETTVDSSAAPTQVER